MPSLPLSAAAARRLLIFDTHPIQYRSPVFQALARRHAAFQVCFFNAQFNARRWWFYEAGKHPKQVWGRPLEEGFPNAVLGTDGLGLTARWRRLCDAVDKIKPDAIAVYGYYLPEHWMLRWLCARRQIPLIFIGETFAPSPSRWRGLIKRPLLRYFFRGIAQFIAIGERNHRYYRGWGVDEPRITRARYCIDTDFFLRTADERRRDRARWRSDLGIGETDFVVLFVGRLFERKRPYDLLALQEKLPQAHFAVVGNGPMEEELLRAAAGRERLHFLGFRDQAQTRQSYCGADLLIVPSEFETWGLVVNEAATCGLPALVTDTCGVAGDLVRDGETGYVFPVGDIAQAAECIARLAADRDLARSLGTRARERAARDFRPEQFADAFLEALARVTAGR